MRHRCQTRFWSCAAAAIAVVLSQPAAHGQDEVWQSLGSGTNQPVSALTLYGGNLIAGGSFTIAGGVSADRIAQWDGTSWAALSSGLDGSVNDAVVYNSDLVVIGSFSTAGGVPCGHIAKWNGSAWLPVGTGVGTAGTRNNAVAVYNGELIAGGNFTSVDGQPANGIARWNGTTWQPLGNGASTIESLVVYNGELIAAGSFITAGGVAANRIARWNGTDWQPLGSGLTGSGTVSVYALAVFNDDLIVGGVFSQAGGVAASRIARWDGSQWHAMGSGMNGGVSALAVHNGVLMAGGEFTTAGGQAAFRFARWNGFEWEAPLGLGINAPVYAITTYGQELVIGGAFTSASGQTLAHIARSTANSTTAPCSTWASLGSFDNIVHAMTIFEGDLIVGGEFTTIDGQSFNRIARFNGAVWTPFGTGMDDAVLSLAVYNEELIAGGEFTTAGGQPVNRIARWDGSQWLPLGSGMSGGISQYVMALTTYNSDLIAGGIFSNAGGQNANNIARWDGSDWHALGAGVGGTAPNVQAILTFGTDLIVGGSFTTAGGGGASNIARWTGSAWQPMSSGMNNSVRALTIFDSQLIAGGAFDIAGGNVVSRVAKWSGSAWQSMGPGIEGPVYALTVYNGELIAGGYFAIFGGNSVPRFIAKWNGATWPTLGSGTPGVVQTLQEFQSHLIAGGWNYALQWDPPNVWSTPASGTFGPTGSWDDPYADNAPTLFGSSAGADPFPVTFRGPAASKSLCIVNQSPTFELGGFDYTIESHTTIGATQTVHLTVNNGTLVSPVVGIGSFGTLSGDATIVGNILSVGTLVPGNPTGAMSLDGNYTQSFATFMALIGPTSFSQLSMTGQAVLQGNLHIELIDGAAPLLGEQFPIITCGGLVVGMFDVALLPFLSDDLSMEVQYVNPSLDGGSPLNETEGGGGEGHTAPTGPVGGSVNINITTPNGSPDPDQAQNFGLTGEPTGVTGAFIQPSATESDLALSIADLDPQNNGNVLILLNNGGGTSFTPVIVEVGHEPSGIACAALADGSAMDDVAVPNAGDNTVSILFHEVSPLGNYTVATISAGIGNAPSAITAADLNGDALADLAVTNQLDNTVSILTNNGDRTFTVQTPIPVGGEPVSIAAGDFLGSPMIDLVIANSTSHTLTILENLTTPFAPPGGSQALGGGVITAPHTVPIGPTPIIVTPTDVDNDRDLDLLASLQGGGSIAMVRNIGGGVVNFGGDVLSSPITLPMDGIPGSLDAWDMDKDGDEDVVVVVFDNALQEPVIRLLRNDSTPTQVAYTIFDPIGQGENPQLVNGSDVNGDVLEDLVSVNVTPLPMGMDGGNDGPRDASMSIRRMLLDAEPLCRADVAPVGALDSVVGVPDLLFIINSWGPCVNPRNCPADIAPEGPPIGDDTVGVPDLLYIINNWGPCPQ